MARSSAVRPHSQSPRRSSMKATGLGGAGSAGSAALQARLLPRASAPSSDGWRPRRRGAMAPHRRSRPRFVPRRIVAQAFVALPRELDPELRLIVDRNHHQACCLQLLDLHQEVEPPFYWSGVRGCGLHGRQLVTGLVAARNRTLVLGLTRYSASRTHGLLALVRGIARS